MGVFMVVRAGTLVGSWGWIPHLSAGVRSGSKALSDIGLTQGSTPRAPKSQSARLEARISRDLHGAVKRAAELQGRTVTDFVVDALQSAASKAITQADHVRMSIADQEAFANALITPAKPNAALKRAFSKANKLLVA